MTKMTNQEKRTLRLEGRRSHKFDGQQYPVNCPYVGWDIATQQRRAEYLHGWWHREYEGTSPALFQPPRYVPVDLI
jgi:hypothetical protein